jgi:hypothetical protein
MSPDGKPLVQGLTEVQSRDVGEVVLMRLDWVGPVEAQEQTTGFVQLVLRREAAHEIGRQLLAASGIRSEPQGRA